MLYKRLTVLVSMSLLAGCGGSGSPAPSQPTISPVGTQTSASPSSSATPTAIPSSTPSPLGSASPGVSPSPSPSPSPGPNTLTLTPSSMQLTIPSQTMNVTASQESYTGAYSVTSTTCGSSVATISPMTTTSGVFTVTEQGSGGPCTFTFQGASGVTAQLTVTASTTSGVISTRHRTVDGNRKINP